MKKKTDSNGTHLASSLYCMLWASFVFGLAFMQLQHLNGICIYFTHTHTFRNSKRKHTLMYICICYSIATVLTWPPLAPCWTWKQATAGKYRHTHSHSTPFLSRTHAVGWPTDAFMCMYVCLFLAFACHVFWLLFYNWVVPRVLLAFLLILCILIDLFKRDSKVQSAAGALTISK